MSKVISIKDGKELTKDSFMRGITRAELLGLIRNLEVIAKASGLGEETVLLEMAGDGMANLSVQHDLSVAKGQASRLSVVRAIAEMTVNGNQE